MFHIHTKPPFTPPVILSVSDGCPLYLRLQEDFLLLLLIIKDPVDHLLTVCQQTLGESLTAEVSLVIFLKGPGSVRVLERMLENISILTFIFSHCRSFQSCWLQSRGPSSLRKPAESWGRGCWWWTDQSSGRHRPADLSWRRPTET